MSGPGLFILAAIGLAGGLAGRWIVRGRQSTFAALVAGVLGLALAVPAAEALGWTARGGLPLALAAAAGATVLLALARVMTRR
ncbi:MAG: hypothetical protein ACOY4K_10360 [Pseudomonadota bacterium]